MDNDGPTLVAISELDHLLWVDAAPTLQYSLSSVDFPCVQSLAEVLEPLAKKFNRSYSVQIGCSACHLHTENPLHTVVTFERLSS